MMETGPEMLNVPYKGGGTALNSPNFARGTNRERRAKRHCILWERGTQMEKAGWWTSMSRKCAR
jgi:hypothetical protein